MKRSVNRRSALAALGCLALAGRVHGQATGSPSGREILRKMEALIWADTMRGEFEMRITTPRWERTLELRIWMDRPKRSFVRVLSPAKEAGIGSLRIGNEMWNYLPAVERTIKIPPSMMLQPWMGSDFTNDDLVKQSSAIDDYVQQVTAEETLDGRPVWRIEARPKPDAPVVWGWIVYWIRKDFIPVKQEYYSDRGELTRVMTFTEIRVVGGRSIPTRWEMKPLGKPGNVTVITVKDAEFNTTVDDEIFTQRNLQRR